MKRVLIIGASGDIGQAVCRQLAAEGWSLYCHYHTNEKKLLRFVNELQKVYPQQDFFMVSLNMLETGEIPSFLDQLFQVDGVVFASGFTHYQLLTDHTEKQMNELWQIHLLTPFLLLKNLQEKLSHSDFGRVVFVGSVYGMTGSSMETVYSAVKAGQQAFAKAYAKEVASLGMTVNVVAPGAIATRMNQYWSESELEKLQAEIPMGRLGMPVEVATAVSYFFSKQAAYTTGVTLPVSGGWLE